MDTRCIFSCKNLGHQRRRSPATRRRRWRKRRRRERGALRRRRWRRRRRRGGRRRRRLRRERLRVGRYRRGPRRSRRLVGRSSRESLSGTPSPAARIRGKRVSARAQSAIGQRYMCSFLYVAFAFGSSAGARRSARRGAPPASSVFVPTSVLARTDGFTRWRCTFCFNLVFVRLIYRNFFWKHSNF